MSFKRVISFGVAAMMSVSLLAGCGNDAAETGGKQSGNDAKTEADDGAGKEDGAGGEADAPDEGNEGASGEVKGANEDAPNTETTDETLRIGLSAEPSTLWGSAVGKVENESQIINSAIMDRLVNVDYRNMKP